MTVRLLLSIAVGVGLVSGQIPVQTVVQPQPVAVAPVLPVATPPVVAAPIAVAPAVVVAAPAVLQAPVVPQLPAVLQAPVVPQVAPIPQAIPPVPVVLPTLPAPPYSVQPAPAPVGSIICVQTAIATAVPSPGPTWPPFSPGPTAFPVPIPAQQYQPPQHEWARPPTGPADFNNGGPAYPHQHPYGYGHSNSPPMFVPNDAADREKASWAKNLKVGFGLHLGLFKPACEEALVMLGARMAENPCSGREQEEAANCFAQAFDKESTPNDFHHLCQDDCVQKVVEAADDVALGTHCDLRASPSRFAYVLRHCPRGHWHSGWSAGAVVLLAAAVILIAALIVLLLWRYHLKP